MYYKGHNLLHTIRQVVNDDAKWRGILRGLNSTFGRQTVTGDQVTGYISRQAGMDLSRVFQQYLTTTKIPVLEHREQNGRLHYRWANVVPGFAMPVRVSLQGRPMQTLRPTERWQSVALPSRGAARLRVDENFYVESRRTTR
jgi:aminopeptidase N